MGCQLNQLIKFCFIGWDGEGSSETQSINILKSTHIFAFMHLAEWLFPKRLTLYLSYIYIFNACIPWESNQWAYILKIGLFINVSQFWMLIWLFVEQQVGEDAACSVFNLQRYSYVGFVAICCVHNSTSHCQQCSQHAGTNRWEMQSLTVEYSCKLQV